MELVHSDLVDGVVTVTMTAPARLNALSDAMLTALHAKFDEIAEDPTAKVVILRGEGKAFCAGHDLKEMQSARQADDGGAAAFQDLFDRCSALMGRIRTLPQPVIAQVHGIATAAGCQLVATCDLAVAAEGTRFGVNGVNIGLFCSTPMVALSRNIGRKRTFELLTTGEFMHTDEARALGLINKIAPPAELDATTQAFAQTIARKLGVAVKIGKEAFYDQLERPTQDAYAYTSAVMVANMLDKDTDEGITAFLEKRPPNWQ